jgi:hypothetical protein
LRVLPRFAVPHLLEVVVVVPAVVVVEVFHVCIVPSGRVVVKPNQRVLIFGRGRRLTPSPPS